MQTSPLRLAAALLFFAGFTTLAACDSGGGNDDDIDSGTIAGFYTIETLRFTSADGRYDVNLVDTLRSSRVFIESDASEFDLEYQLHGSSRRTAVSGSYSLSRQRVTFQAGENNEAAFRRILLPPEFRLRYNRENPDRLAGERNNYEVNLKEFDSQKYSATGVEGTLRIVFERP